ncbi:hypothetical protein [Neptuniibacter sp.]|uniref:hypothetical protein n=1 Tax=Neptuniibacter sp. TaxID=1962643 RepID=UPI002625B668|nr:hypothetical protein [Neptuniibacter sp.]MCP4596157.1 hypothetical protein [Neptuniibacter sp.]
MAETIGFYLVVGFLLLMAAVFGFALNAWLKGWKAYRKWRGGCWVFTGVVGWHKVSPEKYAQIDLERIGRPAWALESYLNDDEDAS